jgi:hypothetical protein
MQSNMWVFRCLTKGGVYTGAGSTLSRRPTCNHAQYDADTIFLMRVQKKNPNDYPARL